MAPFNLNLPEIRLWLPFDGKIQAAISMVAIAGIGAYAYLGIFTPEAQKTQDLKQKLQQAKRDYDRLLQSAQTIEDQKKSIRKNLARISFFDLQEDPLPNLTAQNRAMVFLYQVADLAQVTGNKIIDMQIGESTPGQTAAAPPAGPDPRAGAALATNAIANPGAVLGGGSTPNSAASAAPTAAEPIKLLPINVTLQVRGTYPALKDFLQAVRDLSPLVQLDSFSAQMKKMATAENTPQSAPGNVQPSAQAPSGPLPSSASTTDDEGPFNTLDSNLVFKVNFLQKSAQATP